MDYNALRDEAVRDRVRQAQEFLDPRTSKLEADTGPLFTAEVWDKTDGKPYLQMTSTSEATDQTLC